METHTCIECARRHGRAVDPNTVITGACPDCGTVQYLLAVLQPAAPERAQEQDNTGR